MSSRSSSGPSSMILVGYPFFLALNNDPPGHLVGMERGLENMKHGGLVLGIGDYNLSFMVT